MEKKTALNGHPCVMPSVFKNVCVSPLAVVQRVCVGWLYTAGAVIVLGRSVECCGGGRFLVFR
eukprot:9218725-Prorocentrum_lima.AAC.1